MNRDNSEWVRIGPPDVQTRVTTLAFLPGNPHKLLVGTRPDGFYTVSLLDEGWQPLDVDCLFALAYGPNHHSIAISPHDPNLIFFGIEQHGIMRSTDGGVTWCYANTGLRGKQTYALNGICFCFHPRDARVVFYGSDGGLYRSADRGQMWMPLQHGLPPIRRNPKLQMGREEVGGMYDTTSVWQIQAHRAVPDRIFAGFMCAPPEPGAGMYVSDDAGESWQRCSVGLPAENDLRGVLDFVISSRDPEILVAGCRKGLFITGDGGRTWHPSGTFQCQVYAVCQHPVNANILFVGLDDGRVFMSTDTGSRWHDISKGLPVAIRADPVTIELHHHDGTIERKKEYRWASVVSYLGMNPEPPHALYAACPFGLFKREMER